MNDKQLELVKNKEECCGCGICQKFCPTQAIKIKNDKVGVVYPYVDKSKCIHCGLCLKMCAYGRSNLIYPKVAYAAINSMESQMEISTSGGAFSAIATKFLLEGGFVCGAVMEVENGKVLIEHRIISSVNELKAIQGSKYVQSSIINVLDSIKDLLKRGEKVLFSGTPCQVAGIKKIFSKEDNLYTIDLICHGVPSQKNFSEYIKQLENKYNGKVTNFKFRDKKQGWGKIGSVEFCSGKETIQIALPCENSSFYALFMGNNLQRESCFHCPYARLERGSDITVGDFWGIEDSNPDLLKARGGLFEIENGISCILVNSKDGEKLLEKCTDNLQKVKVNIEDVVAGNSQLQSPAGKGKKRNIVEFCIKYGGYKLVDVLFEKKKKLKRIKNRLKMRNDTK